jgi:hypothetical protein
MRTVISDALDAVIVGQMFSFVCLGQLKCGGKEKLPMCAAQHTGHDHRDIRGCQI